jgi:hypothetical protein
MSIIQISKIQLRRGPESDLPSNPTLDDGELGFTDDTGRLFIGQSTPTDGQPNFNRVAFPFQNIEILTENSPLGQLLAPVVADNQQMFLAPPPLVVTNTFLTIQLPDSSNVLQNYNLDLPGSGVNATIYYYMFDNSNNAFRLGKISVIWNTTMVTAPICADEAEVAYGDPSDFTWTATLVGSFSNQHVVLQYINQTGLPAQVFFRVDRPLI